MEVDQPLVRQEGTNTISKPSLLFVNQHIGRFFNHNLQLPPKLFGPFWAQKPLVPLKESLVPIAPRPQHVQDLKSKSPGERAKVRTK